MPLPAGHFGLDVIAGVDVLVQSFSCVLFYARCAVLNETVQFGMSICRMKVNEIWMPDAFSRSSTPKMSLCLCNDKRCWGALPYVLNTRNDGRGDDRRDRSPV